MPVVYPGGRPLLLMYARRPVNHNWAPLTRADLAGPITYKVMDGTTQVGATGSWAVADVVSDTLLAGDLWPQHQWNVEGQMDAGLLPYGGKQLTVVVEFPLTGETMTHEEPIQTRNVPGYEQPEV
jgi:hypothetical protein